MSTKFAADRPYSDPEKAARKILEIANSVEAVQDGRIHIEKINAPFLFRERATPAEYSACLKLAIARGWLVMHESGTFVRFTQAGADFVIIFGTPDGATTSCHRACCMRCSDAKQGAFRTCANVRGARRAGHRSNLAPALPGDGSALQGAINRADGHAGARDGALSATAGFLFFAQ